MRRIIEFMAEEPIITLVVLAFIIAGIMGLAGFQPYPSYHIVLK